MDPDPFEFDESDWPILRLSFREKMSDDDFARYLETYRGYIARGGRYGLIMDVSTHFGMLPMTQARMQMDFLAREAPRLREVCWGVAFVLPGPIHRGALRAMLKMQPMPMDFTVVGTHEDARAWLAG